MKAQQYKQNYIENTLCYNYYIIIYDSYVTIVIAFILLI